jgi:hypothetical protein
MDPLERLHADLLAVADPALGESNSRVSVLDFGQEAHIEYIGSAFDEPFDKLCATICEPSVASRLGSLILRSAEDEGANGTRNWDLAQLLGGPDFPLLRSVQVEQNRPGDHNRIIIGSVYDEAGAIATLLHKSPRLQFLAVPSAPDQSFFTGPRHEHLHHLSVDSGYDTQGFIANLAGSSTFPTLYALEFGEYNETYVDDFLSHCTPFQAYSDLFRSAAFARVRLFVWRNPQCTEAELEELSAMRPARDLQFKVVTHSSRYV